MTRLGQMLIEEGWEKGQTKGREEGREEIRMESLRNIMETLKLSPEQAMDALKIPDSERTKYQSSL
ncbi:MAG: hypothetical protein LIO96_02805 [Lachnospiraceae bacterium]|nr:hypothetical protein [Lachnospiraceae bacterium]